MYHRSFSKARYVPKRPMWLCATIVFISSLAHSRRDIKSVPKYASFSLQTSTPSTRTSNYMPSKFQLSSGDGLWHGTLDENLSSEGFFISPPVTIVVAFCEHNLGWLDDFVRGLNVRNIIVYSKCGNSVKNISRPFTELKLRNVGRVDHAYAYHLANLSEDTDPDEVQLFIKDTYPKFHQAQLRQRSLQEVIREAAGSVGFSCGSSPHWRNTLKKAPFLSRSWFHSLSNYGAEWSAWHLSSELAKFQLSNYQSAGGYASSNSDEFASNLTFDTWWGALGTPMPGPLMLVCYAGTFATKPANIIASRRVWLRMLTILERGDNIVEGHYAERTYAALLMPSVPSHIHDRILCLSTGVRKCAHTAVFCGLLYGCSYSCGSS